MHRTKCHFCGIEGPEGEDPFDAADAACREGFHRIDIPFRDEGGKQGGRVRFLCGHCAKHAALHFTPGPKELKALDVLVPLEEDESFEDDQGW